MGSNSRYLFGCTGPLTLLFLLFAGGTEYISVRRFVFAFTIGIVGSAVVDQAFGIPTYATMLGSAIFCWGTAWFAAGGFRSVDDEGMFIINEDDNCRNEGWYIAYEIFSGVFLGSVFAFLLSLIFRG